MWSDTVAGAIKPIWVLSQLFLMCYKSVDDKIKVKKISFFSKVFQKVYIAVAIFSVLYITYATTSLKISPKISSVTQLGQLFFSIGNNGAMLSTVFFNLLYQNRVTKLVSRLHKIDKSLKRSYKWKSYKNVKLFVVGELIFTLGIWIPFFINYVFIRCAGTFWKCFYNWTVIYTSTKISHVIVLQFCVFVILIQTKISTINENIKEYFTQEHHSRCDFGKALREIEKIYGEVVLACSEVQAIFSVPLLMKIASQFIGIFCTLYFCLFGFMYNDRIVKPQTFMEMIIPLSTVFICGVQVVTTVAVCDLTVMEFKRTGKIIHRIHLERGDTFFIDRINLFSLQLLHWNLEFHAYGFFSINGSLLKTLMSEVASSRVALCQFRACKV